MRVLLLFFSLLILHESEAQDKFEFELNSGISYSIPYQKEVSILITDVDVDGGTNTNYNSNNDYFIGFLISYKLNNKQSLSTGLSYVKYSLEITDYQLFQEQEGHLETNYFNIPFLFNQKYSDSSSFSISFGPYVGILIDANENGTSYTDRAIVQLNPNNPRFQLQKEYNNDISNDYQNMDFGLLIQQNFEIKIHKSLFLNLFARFNLGLMNVITSDIFDRETEYSAAEKWFNSYASFGGGIKF